jgi:hypothetical protein
MNYGFATFLTEDYIPIASNLLRSILCNSQYNVEVYCINFCYPFLSSYPTSKNRIIYKRYDTTDLSFKGILEAKIYASLHSSFDITLILDADMLMLKDIDKIFEDQKERLSQSNIPLFACHPHHPYQEYKSQLDQLTTKSPRMNWVYANYIFSPTHRPFFEKAWEWSRRFSFVDEVIFNGLLIELEARDHMGYNYFPNCLVNTVRSYFDPTYQNGWNEITQCYGNTPVRLYALHGHLCKDVKFSSQIVTQMELTRKPV